MMRQWQVVTLLPIAFMLFLIGCQHALTDRLSSSSASVPSICAWHSLAEAQQMYNLQRLTCSSNQQLQLVWNEELKRSEQEQLSPIYRTENDEPATASDEASSIDYAGIVYLTFDDGPGKYSEQMLDVLALEKIPATFFVLGEQAEKYPELLARMKREGHSIGNHSYNHVYSELYGSFTNFSEQIVKTSEIINNATGEHSSLYRSPGGSHKNLDQSFYDALVNAGYIIFDWNVDSGDSSGSDVSSETIVSNIVQAKLSERVIVLMHDRNKNEATLAALPAIIAYYKEQNYQFAQITEETAPMISNISTETKWDRQAATKLQQQAFAQKVLELQQ